MAKANVAPVEEIDIDIEEIEFDDSVTVTEVDPVEAEIQASADKATGKTKKDKGEAKEGLASTKALAKDEVGAGFIADLCGVDARELRMFLRKKYRNMDAEKSQRYVWKKGDPQIQQIVDAFKAAKSAPRTVTPKAVVATEAAVETVTEAAPIEDLNEELI